MVVGERVVKCFENGKSEKLGDVAARRHRTKSAMTQRRLHLDSEHKVCLLSARFGS